MALRLWQKSWKRNVPNSQMWIPEKPSFTSTRRTSEREKPLLGSSRLSSEMFSNRSTAGCVFCVIFAMIKYVSYVLLMFSTTQGSTFCPLAKKKKVDFSHHSAFMASRRFVIITCTSGVVIRLVYGLRPRASTRKCLTLTVTGQALYVRTFTALD